MTDASKDYSFSIFAGASLELPKILIVCPGVTAQFIAMKDQLISLPHPYSHLLGFHQCPLRAKSNHKHQKARRL